MNNKVDRSEIIFKIIAYVLVTIFAILCLYPLLYTLGAALSSRDAMINGKVILFPVGFQLDAFQYIFSNSRFWISYANTLFLTFYGTLFSMLVTVGGAYALSKKRLIKRRLFNFLLVFTMWFSAGMVPTYYNYLDTLGVLNDIGITDSKWLVVIAMGMAAFNVILLRNAFESVPAEIEEAAIVDGAKDFQLLTRVYIPMNKPAIATVALFYGISRWNGYFWARQMIKDSLEHPLQVFLREELENIDTWTSATIDPYSYIYALIICAIIPIIIIYPYIQKYFARGVNVGGVKE